MPGTELDQFFRTNTQELPQVTVGWFALPNRIDRAINRLDNDRFLLKLLALTDHDLDDISGVHHQIPITHRTEAFLEGVAIQENRWMSIGEGETALSVYSRNLMVVPNIMSGDQLPLILEMLYQGRGLLQEDLLKKGSLPSVAGYSAAVDLMRADLIAGQITDRGEVAADCLRFGGMTLLPVAIMNRVAGR